MAEIEDHDYNSWITYKLEEKHLENKELSLDYYNFIKNKINHEAELSLLREDINKLDDIPEWTDEYKKIFDALNLRIHSALGRTRNEEFLRELINLNTEYWDWEDRMRIIPELRKYHDLYWIWKDLINKEIIPNTVSEMIFDKPTQMNLKFIELFNKEVIEWIQQRLGDKDFYKDSRDKIEEFLRKLQK